MVGVEKSRTLMLFEVLIPSMLTLKLVESTDSSKDGKPKSGTQLLFSRVKERPVS